jgi:hypothetical protein
MGLAAAVGTDNVPSSIPITGRPMKQHCDRKRHRAVGKESELTSYIERFNNTKAATSVTASKKDIIVLFEVTILRTVFK